MPRPVRLVRLALDTPHGRLAVVAANTRLAEAAAELVLRDHERGGAGVERVDLGGIAAWFKRSTLSGRARWRWGLKRALGWSVPRVREHANLAWLRRAGFQAPEPLAAGVLVRRGLPLLQFLATRHVHDALTLVLVLRAAIDPRRAALLDELALEVARMHALGFVHHDLYPRNVLVLPAEHARRIVFLDAWAGGPPPQLRPPAYDLACLFLHADRELGRDEVARFLELYARERGWPVDARRMMARIRRIRSGLVQRLAARPHERRGDPLPGLEW